MKKEHNNSGKWNFETMSLGVTGKERDNIQEKDLTDEKGVRLLSLKEINLLNL